MSLHQDSFKGKIVGNLISDPSLVDDDNGSKICLCRVATNTKGRKFDPKTGRELRPDERHKYRSVVELRIVKPAVADKFAKLFKYGDRVTIKGEFGTRKVKKSFWSEKDREYVNIQVDVDNDGQNIQDVWEDQLVMVVDEFAKIVLSSEGNYLVQA